MAPDRGGPQEIEGKRTPAAPTADNLASSLADLKPLQDQFQHLGYT